MPATLYFLPEEVLFGETQGRVVAARRNHTDDCWAVNQVSKRVLEHFERPIALEDVCLRIVNEFAVDAATCRASIEPVFAKLEAMGWIEPLPAPGSGDSMRQPYLELLKRALVNLIYPEHELRMRFLAGAEAAPTRQARDRELRDIRWREPERYAELIRCKQVGGVLHGEPTRDSHTMVGLRRLDNIEYCARHVFADGVPGDFLEAGVCQGGAAIYLRALQVAFGQGSRRTWVADSFQGLPPPSEPADEKLDLTEQRFPWLSISEKAVRENFRTYELLSDQVRFLGGWFDQSLPGSDTGPLALLRIDADLYRSTRDVLDALYARVQPGGYVIVDDYHAFAACRQAVDEFRQAYGIADTLRTIDWTGVFWRKTAQ
ncbi:Macrocin O-methyltransferase [Pigmentiphaga humi]|uniref:Macrocin O-methyltransferase n=1 Tax=Pigmentiphaga humi TaxID=2478468 RepID=A0A3P4B4K3_9BURK|nr:PqqD family peptide modification chaperone [Pigmentiphaga humi]VCU71229.1 Macrocin O-methyltransferase [Pigmentiphaga humi]